MAEASVQPDPWKLPGKRGQVAGLCDFPGVALQLGRDDVLYGFGDLHARTLNTCLNR